MLELIQRNDIQPRCPHCDTDLRSIMFRELAGFLGRRYVYFCGACQAVLGISHRKGFFMG